MRGTLDKLIDDALSAREDDGYRRGLNYAYGRMNPALELLARADVALSNASIALRRVQAEGAQVDERDFEACEDTRFAIREFQEYVNAAELK